MFYVGVSWCFCILEFPGIMNQSNVIWEFFHETFSEKDMKYIQHTDRGQGCKCLNYA